MFRRPWRCCSSSSPTGRCSAVNGTAFAVTPALRESYAEGDDDELADVALREAALASVRLLAGAADEPSSGLPPRRAVLVAEVDGATARPDLDDAVVRLSGPVAIDDVIAAYVDNARRRDRRAGRDRRRRRRRSGG